MFLDPGVHSKQGLGEIRIEVADFQGFDINQRRGASLHLLDVVKGRDNIPSEDDGISD